MIHGLPPPHDRLIDDATARLSSPGCANRLSATMVSAGVPNPTLVRPRVLTVLLTEMVTYMKEVAKVCLRRPHAAPAPRSHRAAVAVAPLA